MYLCDLLRPFINRFLLINAPDHISKANNSESSWDVGSKIEIFSFYFWHILLTSPTGLQNYSKSQLSTLVNWVDQLSDQVTCLVTSLNIRRILIGSSITFVMILYINITFCRILFFCAIIFTNRRYEYFKTTVEYQKVIYLLHSFRDWKRALIYITL